MTPYRDDGATRDTAEPLAIVGVGCRLPGKISTVDELFTALRSGRNCIKEVPPDRWDVDAYYDADPLTAGKTYVRYGGFVSDIDRFDAAFFGITDAEASRMDPQQRMVLETVWHALEDAGQSAEELMHSNTGVFLAMMNTNGYSQLKAIYEGLMGVTAYDAMGDAMSITAGRISHFLGLEGPCLALDTACSGSLVALHLARQSILAGDCDTAIVAGVSAILHPGIHIAFSKVGLMSRAGRCAAFDALADGYIRGEGCVAVILRRQSLALARGDRIMASIVGTAVNQDGRTPAVTAPNGRSQEKVVRMALARVGLSPSEIGYVEAHGTGTPVGDPIEMSALVNVYGPDRANDDPLYIGSVKTNFGHIEAGAGLLGLVKAALSLEREMILPNLHFTRLNPNIDLGQAPIQVATRTIPWPRGQRRRLAGVNSFGYSGTNAHAILQEAPVSGEWPAEIGNQGDRETGRRGDVVSGEGAPGGRPAELVLLSARGADSLQALVDRWMNYLQDDDSTPLTDIAFTAATGRSHLSHRLAVVAQTKEDVAAKLRAWREGRLPDGLFAGQTIRRKPKIAFVFTGQGAQYAGMGRQLYEMEPRFKDALDRCASLMDTELGVGPSTSPSTALRASALSGGLHEVLFGPSSADLLSDTRYVQPALFALEYALAELLHYWGVEPDFVIGHSVGEIVAACIAGVLDLEDAARFVVARGRLMGQLPPGGKMVALDATLEEAQAWIQGHEADVAVATVNGPRAVVVSGRAQAVDAVAQLARADGRRSKELDVSHAFHSPLMEPILEELSAVAATMRILPARIPVVSNVTGDFMDEGISGDYWSAHVRQAVLFHQGMAKIIDAGATLVVEIGPQPALSPAVASAFDISTTRIVPTLMRDQQDVSHLLESLAALYCSGVPLDLDRLYWSPAYGRVSLPLYPFRRDRHWLRPETAIDPVVSGRWSVVSRDGEDVGHSEVPLQIQSELHPLLGRLVSANSRRVVFECDLATTLPWTDHRVLGATVFPATAYLEMAARGFAALSGQDWQPVTLGNVAFERPLILAYRKQKKVRLILDLSSNGAGEAKFTITATEDGAFESYCRGRITAASDALTFPRSGRWPVASGLAGSITAADGRRASSDGDDTYKKVETGFFYGELRKSGLEYGANFATVREVWSGGDGSGEAAGRITASVFDEPVDEDPFASTRMLDGCLQLFGAALATLGSPPANNHQGAFVPASIQLLSLARQLPSSILGHVTVRTNDDGQAALAHLRLMSDEGEALAEIEGLELRRKESLAMAATSGEARAGGSTGIPPQPGGGQANGQDDPGLRFAARDELIAQLQELPKKQRVERLTKWLAAEVKETMGQAGEGLDLDNLEPTTAFLEIGLDSLMVTELQRRIQEKLDFRFQPMQGLDYQSIESLAEFIHDEVLVIQPV